MSQLIALNEPSPSSLAFVAPSICSIRHQYLQAGEIVVRPLLFPNYITFHPEASDHLDRSL